MKKTALLFIALLGILASIDFIWPFTTERTDGDVFGQGLNTAEMQTYQDPDLGFTVRYPSFFAVQPDSLDEYTGHVRFSYDNEWATVVLECYALRNYGQSLKAGWTRWHKCFMRQTASSVAITSSSLAHSTKMIVV